MLNNTWLSEKCSHGFVQNTITSTLDIKIFLSITLVLKLILHTYKNKWKNFELVLKQYRDNDKSNGSCIGKKYHVKTWNKWGPPNSTYTIISTLQTFHQTPKSLVPCFRLWNPLDVFQKLTLSPVNMKKNLFCLMCSENINLASGQFMWNLYTLLFLKR